MKEGTFIQCLSSSQLKIKRSSQKSERESGYKRVDTKHSRCASIISMDISMNISMDLSMDIHIHGKPADFKNSFTVTISRKFATQQSLNIPPHLKHVAF